MTCTVITQMDWQIFHPDPGKNYNVRGYLRWRPALQNGKKIFIAVVQIVARLQIVMLDDTVLSCKNLVGFR